MKIRQAANFFWSQEWHKVGPTFLKEDACFFSRRSKRYDILFVWSELPLTIQHPNAIFVSANVLHDTLLSNTCSSLWHLLCNPGTVLYNPSPSLCNPGTALWKGHFPKSYMFSHFETEWFITIKIKIKNNFKTFKIKNFKSKIESIRDQKVYCMASTTNTPSTH